MFIFLLIPTALPASLSHVFRSCDLMLALMEVETKKRIYLNPNQISFDTTTCINISRRTAAYNFFVLKMLVRLILVVALAIVSNAHQMEVWLTDLDANILFQQETSISASYINSQDSGETVIDVDATEKYQTIDGFGYTLTGGSAMHLQNPDTSTRTAIPA